MVTKNLIQNIVINETNYLRIKDKIRPLEINLELVDFPNQTLILSHSY